MTGPEHYREAEQLLGARGQCRNPEPCEFCMRNLLQAQVHATLAAAAATADAFVPSVHYQPWSEVTR